MDPNLLDISKAYCYLPISRITWLDAIVTSLLRRLSLEASTYIYEDELIVFENLWLNVLMIL